MHIQISKFSTNFADPNIGENLLNHIIALLKKREIIDLDFANVTTMTTFCAKQIFGKLYLDLGAEHFFEKIRFLNVDEDLKSIIQEGVESVIDSSNDPEDQES